MTDSFFDRRTALKFGAAAGGLGLMAPHILGNAHAAETGPILVVLELSGGNDGLNTVVPFGDDAYYRLRPKLGLKPDKLRKLDEHFGLAPGMAGIERLYKDGKVAIVHGAGYPQPSFSHFTSMAYWHTAAPNSGEAYGWVGRLADALVPAGTPNAIVNIDAVQSLAVRSRDHVPIVFDDPARFGRKGRGGIVVPASGEDVTNPARAFLQSVARGAQDASGLVRDAWSAYSSPADYGLVDLDLPKIAALIEARLPTRLYYTSFRNNIFDTHVHQPALHARLLTYFSDAVAAFMADMERIGRADDVVVLVFSEFGRRPAENTNRGTDHGTANAMFAIGKDVNGGHHGIPPSLTDLDETENMKFTTDFRRVLATVIEDWLGHADASDVLREKFERLPIFKSI